MIWFKTIRPGTLMAFLSPVCIGLWVARKYMPIDWAIALITLFTAAFIQILSNLVNDYYDFKRGADSSDRLGPQRSVSAGLISPKALKRAIMLFSSLAVIGGAYLIYIGGWPILLIGLTSLLFAYLYSATNHSLSHLGIADLFVLVYFGPVATAGTTYLQTGGCSIESVILGVGCGFISMAVLTVNNVRDYAQDLRVEKRTIIVRYGITFGKIYYFTLLFLPIAILLWITSLHQAAILTMTALLLSFLFLKSEGKQYNRILIFTGLYNIVYAICILLL